MRKSTIRFIYYPEKIKLPVRRGLTVELYPEGDHFQIKNYSIIGQQEKGEIEIVIRLKPKP